MMNLVVNLRLFLILLLDEVLFFSQERSEAKKSKKVWTNRCQIYKVFLFFPFVITISSVICLFISFRFVSFEFNYLLQNIDKTKQHKKKGNRNHFLSFILMSFHFLHVLFALAVSYIFNNPFCGFIYYFRNRFKLVTSSSFFILFDFILFFSSCLFCVWW